MEGGEGEKGLKLARTEPKFVASEISSVFYSHNVFDINMLQTVTHV